MSRITLSYVSLRHLYYGGAVGSLLGKGVPKRNSLQFNYIRSFSRLVVSKNLEVLSANKLKLKKDEENNPLVVSENERPLVIMLAWMLSEYKHLKKYAEIYFDKGYDVLTVTITPWQLMWPLKGSQMIAEEVLQFLRTNSHCSPLLIHGFSVGGYLWGEVLVKMNQDMETYKPVINRIVGQTWDSAADITELPRGLPHAMFPNNQFLRTTLEKYMSYHLRTFYDVATQHYVRSSQMFHTTLIKAPALMFVCKTDHVGSVASNSKVRESWDSMGMKTYWKCWDKSKHVSHLMLHREEYLETLDNFLLTLETLRGDDKILQKAQMQV